MVSKLTLWIWPFVLMALVYAGTFVYTKNKRLSLNWAFKALLLAVACFSIIEFELYLEQIFVGHYNQMGIPSHYSHSGWRLMMDAWPIWVVPVYLLILIKAFTTWTYALFQEAQLNPKEEPSFDQSATTSSVKSQLAQQDMQMRLEKTLLQFEQAKQARFELETRVKQLELALTRANQATPRPVSTNAQALQRIIDELHDELSEAHDMIEALLKQIHEHSQQEQERDDFF